MDRPALKPSGKPPAKKPSPKQAQKEALVAPRSRELPGDPLSTANLKKLGVRLGIPVLVLWIGAFILNGPIPKIVVGVITVALAGLALWAVRFARRSRAVAEIVRDVDSPEARKQAISKLDTEFKKDDTAAIFAKAQLLMQEDPRQALATLETIKLEKVMAPVADEARIQRAMLHLILGETDEARQLADGVDLSRHKETKTRAMMAAIIGEAWARSGQAKKAVEILETFDPEDDAFAELRPQLLRSRAFAYAWASNTKQMKQTLRRLSQLNPQFLSGFITRKKVPGGVSPKGIHPLLEKEAFEMVMKSGMIPRRMEVKRG
jgi:hypothetical protein